uniref:CRAL-TRIO domain-containing protein n=1 Tax=Rhabditophanes sp. KR3021 TaxID=114890 RepID=A0AC35TP40_9BILA
MPPNKHEVLDDVHVAEGANFMKPIPFTADIIEKASELLVQFDSFLPEDLKTTFFLARWVRMYQGDVENIEIKLKEYIRHRAAFKYDDVDLVGAIEKLEFVDKVFSKFAISKLDQTNMSGDVVVFLQKMEGSDIKEIIKTMPFSNVLNAYFVMQETMQRAMHKHEKETGRQACASIILDLHGINLSDFINPLGAPSKLARLVVKIWSEYFSETTSRLYLVRSPGLISLMWQVAKYILDAKTQKQVVFVDKFDHLKAFFNENAIPVKWGGARQDNSSHSEDKDECFNKIQSITPSMYYDSNEIFIQNGFAKIPALHNLSIKNKEIESIEVEGKVGQKIIWHYYTNSELVFDVIYENNENVPIIPGTFGTCLKVPEQGVIEVNKNGTYCFRWSNINGGWLSAKVQYVILLK